MPGVDDLAGNVVDSVAGSAVDSIAESVSQAMADMLASLGTIWVSIDTEAVGSGSNTQVGAPADQPGAGGIEAMLGWALYVSLGICVVSLMVAWVRFARSKSSEPYDLADEGGRIGTVLISVILLSGASSIVAALMRFNTDRGSEPVAFLQSNLWYYTLAAAVLSVIVGAVRMAWEQRVEPGRDLVKSLLTLMLVAGAAVPAIAILAEASDKFAEAILTRSLECPPSTGPDTALGAGEGGCFANNMGDLILLGGQTAPFLVIVLGFIAICVSAIQIMLMMARSAMLVILAGILPLASSATNTEMGRNWFKKSISWLIAWLLYKPTAAIVYATAFKLLGGDRDQEGIVQFLTGLILLCMAVIALPALMRFVNPAVGAMASGSGGGGLALAAAAVPAMGAISAFGRGGGSDAGGGDSGASSASGPASGATSTGSTGMGGPSGGGGGAGSAGAAPGGASGATSAAGSGAAGAGAGAAAAAGPAGAAVVAAGAAKQVGQAGLNAATGAVESAANNED